MAELPVIVLAFANEQEGHRYLRDLPEELRQLQAILEAAEGKGLCNLVVRPNARLDQILETFTEHRDRVAIFHYGGHAGGDRLFLETTGTEGAVAHAEGLARIITASEDTTARVWDAESGKPLASLQGHTAAVGSAAFSPDGKRIITASEDTTARVWDADSGKTLAPPPGAHRTGQLRRVQPRRQAGRHRLIRPQGAGLAPGSDRRECRHLVALGGGLHRNRTPGWYVPVFGGR